jgi:hypothetical protein
LFCFINQAFSQGTYTAVRSGKWSNPITWDVSGIPSTVCNNCTITINSGLTIQLDQHVELSGASLLYIGNGGTGATQLTIGNSSQTTISAGYNIVLDTVPGTSMIILRTSSSSIDGTAAGTYDGIFVGPLPNSIYQKVIGNAPSLFVGNSIYGTSPPRYTTLSGPVTLFSGGTLPVTLASFNVALNDNVVNITWTIDQQLNLNHFIVLRSGDGVSWTTVGKVAVQASSSNYSFTDLSPYHGLNYYRLQAVDNDGNYNLSEVKLVRAAFNKGLVLGPNPASDHVSLTFGTDISTNVIVRLINQYGQVLQQKQLTNPVGTTISLPVSSYPQGIYTLHVKGTDGSQSAYRIFIAH